MKGFFFSFLEMGRNCRNNILNTKVQLFMKPNRREVEAEIKLKWSELKQQTES